MSFSSIAHWTAQNAIKEDAYNACSILILMLHRVQALTVFYNHLSFWHGSAGNNELQKYGHTSLAMDKEIVPLNSEQFYAARKRIYLTLGEELGKRMNDNIENAISSHIPDSLSESACDCFKDKNVVFFGDSLHRYSTEAFLSILAQNVTACDKVAAFGFRGRRYGACEGSLRYFFQAKFCSQNWRSGSNVMTEWQSRYGGELLVLIASGVGVPDALWTGHTSMEMADSRDILGSIDLPALPLPSGSSAEDWQQAEVKSRMSHGLAACTGRGGTPIGRICDARYAFRKKKSALLLQWSANDRMNRFTKFARGGDRDDITEQPSGGHMWWMSADSSAMNLSHTYSMWTDLTESIQAGHVRKGVGNDAVVSGAHTYWMPYDSHSATLRISSRDAQETASVRQDLIREWWEKLYRKTHRNNTELIQSLLTVNPYRINIPLKRIDYVFTGVGLHFMLGIRIRRAEVFDREWTQNAYEAFVRDYLLWRAVKDTASRVSDAVGVRNRSLSFDELWNDNAEQLSDPGRGAYEGEFLQLVMSSCRVQKTATMNINSASWNTDDFRVLRKCLMQFVLFPLFEEIEFSDKIANLDRKVAIIMNEVLSSSTVRNFIWQPGQELHLHKVPPKTTSRGGKHYTATEWHSLGQWLFNEAKTGSQMIQKPKSLPLRQSILRLLSLSRRSIKSWMTHISRAQQEKKFPSGGIERTTSGQKPESLFTYLLRHMSQAKVSDNTLASKCSALNLEKDFDGRMDCYIDEHVLKNNLIAPFFLNRRNTTVSDPATIGLFPRTDTTSFTLFRAIASFIEIFLQQIELVGRHNKRVSGDPSAHLIFVGIPFRDATLLHGFWRNTQSNVRVALLNRAVARLVLAFQILRKRAKVRDSNDQLKFSSIAEFSFKFIDVWNSTRGGFAMDGTHYDFQSNVRRWERIFGQLSEC